MVTAPVVRRISDEYLSGVGVFAIAQRLTADGVFCPSAYDPARNRYRSGVAWSKSAVRTILGGSSLYRVSGVEKVAQAGVVDRRRRRCPGAPDLTWNLKDVWVYADQPVHPALVRKHVTTLTDLSVGAAVHPAADRCSTSCRHLPGDRWFVDETYVKVAGRWAYLYRAIDQDGQVIDVLVSQKRDLAATRQFFLRALEHGPHPTEVSTDRAPAYPRVIEELIPAACHVTEQCANNPVEADHGRLKARLRPMRGLKRLRSARVISAGHAFVQNLRRGHYELGWDIDRRYRLTSIFAELARAI
jgi:transposase, IS6 family